MLTGKPSTRLHEVIDTRYKYTMVVCTGSRTACNAFWLKQPAQSRQHFLVRVAGR
jgi:hypothetical protein